MKDVATVISAIVIAIVSVCGWLAAIAAWVTHVYVCIKAGAWVLLAFGCIVAPVGVIHGVGVWLGAF